MNSAFFDTFAAPGSFEFSFVALGLKKLGASGLAQGQKYSAPCENGSH